jgi:hypothetical protein
MLDSINYWRQSTKTPMCYNLAGNSKLKEIFRNFSSHENGKQRLLVRDSLMLRKIIAQE